MSRLIGFSWSRARLYCPALGKGPAAHDGLVDQVIMGQVNRRAYFPLHR